MKKKLISIFLFCLITGTAFSEEKKEVKEEAQNEAILLEKVEVMEKYIKKIVEELVKQQKETIEIKKEIEQIKENNSKLSQIIRNLEIYVKSTSSIRPDESQWESIKRGMSTSEVEKVLGRPELIETVRRVGNIWYYYGLGSITFNENNIVSERKNFKRHPHNLK